MFEDSLFESTARGVSRRSRWATAASIVTQGLLAACVMLIPLLHIGALPERAHEVSVLLPPPVQLPPRPAPTHRDLANTAGPSAPTFTRTLVAPRVTPSRIDPSAAPLTSAASFSGMAASGPPAAALGFGNASTVAVAVTPQRKAGPARISGGVIAGLLLAPIRPSYPPIAKAAHVEGIVVVEAVISKSGAIESLHVLSGPAMLQSAAIDAIRTAHYKPFQLNGEPAAVQTTITVNFKISS